MLDFEIGLDGEDLPGVLSLDRQIEFAAIADRVEVEARYEGRTQTSIAAYSSGMS